MAERTLAEAVANIRLSDSQLAGDQRRIRQQVLSFVTLLERDAKVNVRVNVDDDNVLTQFAALERAAQDFAPTTTLHINADKALDDLAALQALGGDMSIDIGVNLDAAAAQAELEGTLDSTEQKLVAGTTRAGAAAGEGFSSTFGRAMTTSLTAVSAAVGGFIATSLFKGFQRFTTIQDSTASLTVQLGSAADAAQLLGDVLEVVRGTPFNLDQFANAAAQMVTFGIAAEKVPGFLTAIGEASASRGSQANELAQRLSVVFGQIQSLGRLTGEDLIQFSEAGVDALTILANSAGVTTEEMRKMISEGAVPAEQALDALSSGILNGTTGINGATVAFAGTMDKLRDTLSGSIGGFSAATARFGVSIIEPLTKSLTTGLNAMSDVLDTIGGRIKKALSGLGDSDIVKGIDAFFEGLPEKIGPAIDSLTKLGSVIAPLGAALAAGGLGQLTSILPAGLGNLIPTVLTNPLIAATAALIAFTPELRDELLPIVGELGKEIGKLGVVLAPLAGKLIDSLVPLAENLIKAAGAMLPLVDAAVEFAGVFAAVVTPALQAFAVVLGHIPVEVLEALAAGFLAMKVASATLPGVGGLLDRLQDGMNRLNVTAQRQDQILTKSVDVANKAALGLGAGLAGLAATSQDTTTKLTGLAGVAATVGIGFASGGAPGGGIALAGAALGVLAGMWVRNSEKAREMKANVDAVATSMSKATIELIANRDALDDIAKSATEASAAYQLLGEAATTALPTSDKLTGAASDLGLPLVGPDAKQRLGEILAAVTDPGGLQKVPELMTAINVAFGENGDVVAAAADQYRNFNKLVEDATFVQAQLAGGVSESSLLKMGFSQEIIDLARDGGPMDQMTNKQKEILQGVLDLQNVASTTDIGAVFRESLQDSAGASDRFRVALEIAEKQPEIARRGINRFSDDQKELQQLTDETIRLLTDESKRVEDLQIRQALTLQGNTKAQIDEIFRAANATGLDVLDLDAVDLGPLENEIRDARAQAEEVTDAIDGWTTPINAAEEATKRFNAALDQSKKESQDVVDLIEHFQDVLSDTSTLQAFSAGLQQISTDMSAFVNQKDLDEASKLGDSIANQKDKVDDLRASVAEALGDAQVKATALDDRIREAQEAGAFRGVALLQREREKVFDDAKKKQDDLAKAEADLQRLEADLAKLATIPITLKQTLVDQAKFVNLSVFDLLVQGTTPQSAAAFEKDIQPSIATALQMITDELNDKGPEAAAALANTLRDQLLFGFVASGIDPATAQQLIDFFVPAQGDLELQSQQAAAATAEAFMAELRKKITEDPDFDLAGLSMLGIDVEPIVVPTVIAPPTEEETERARTEAQDLIDRHEQLKATIVAHPDGPAAAAAVEELQSFVNANPLTVPIDFNLLAQQQEQKRPVLGAPIPIADGGIIEFFRRGGFHDPAHIAHIAPAGTWRVFAEPETGGEGYIPLGGAKRERSTAVLRQIADMFGYTLASKKAPVVPVGLMGTATSDADRIGASVARHMMAAAGKAEAMRMASKYDQTVNVAEGAIVVHETASPRKTSLDVVRRLHDLAMMRR